MTAITNILVATDFEAPSDAALRYARAMAHQFHATLHVLHVIDDLTANDVAVEGYALNLDALQQARIKRARLDLQALITDDDRQALDARDVLATSSSPANAIVAYANDAHIDLIVVGTHGRQALAHLFLGSVAERVVRLAPCPVLTVRHPEREFVE